MRPPGKGLRPDGLVDPDRTEPPMDSPTYWHQLRTQEHAGEMFACVAFDSFHVKPRIPAARSPLPLKNGLQQVSCQVR